MEGERVPCSADYFLLFHEKALRVDLKCDSCNERFEFRVGFDWGTDVMDLSARVRGEVEEWKRAHPSSCRVLAGARETQESVTSWQNTTFPGAKGNLKGYVLRCLEEMAELAVAAGCGDLDIFGRVSKVTVKHLGIRVCNPVKVREEAADVNVVLYGVANAGGFDLAEEVDKKMAVNRAREWNVDPVTGFGQHVRKEHP